MTNKRSTVLPRYTRVSYKSFEAAYVRLERGVKPEHEHSTLQISVALGRQPMIAAERNSHGFATKQPFLPGEICVVPSWQRHAINWNQQTEWISFHYREKFVEFAASAFNIKPSVEIKPFFCGRDKVISQIGHALGQVMRHTNEPSNTFVETLAANLIEHLFKNYPTEKTNLRVSNGGLAPAKLRRVIELIDARLAENLKMEELAASVELSAFHFARAFKKTTGYAPHQFIIRRRMENAKLMLLERKANISEVARQVGYHSHSRFSRLFQKHTALTPKQFRKII